MPSLTLATHPRSDRAMRIGHTEELEAGVAHEQERVERAGMRLFPLAEYRGAEHLGIEVLAGIVILDHVVQVSHPFHVELRHFSPPRTTICVTRVGTVRSARRTRADIET